MRLASGSVMRPAWTRASSARSRQCLGSLKLRLWMIGRMPLLVLRPFTVVRQWSAAISQGAAGRPPSRRILVRLGGVEEMLEPGGRDGYMLYETTFSERKPAP